MPPERRFARFEDLLDLDAIAIGTPMHLNACQCVAALDAGKHGLSEVTAEVPEPGRKPGGPRAQTEARMPARSWKLTCPAPVELAKGMGQWAVSPKATVATD